MPLSKAAIESIEAEYRAEYKLQYLLQSEDTSLATEVEDLVGRMRANKSLIFALSKVLKEAGVDVHAIAKEIRQNNA